MSHPLIDRSPDLQRLRDEGYDIDVVDACLLVQVPFVNASREVRTGTLVSTLALAGDITAAPDTHVMYFAGDQPCNKDGTEISSIKHSTSTATMGGITIQRSFSNKPPNGYRDYYDKVTRYAEIISAPARALNPLVSATPLPVLGAKDSVFEYLDNASSRVGIAEASKKLELAAIAIVGLGGTGSYVLDFVAKTQVKKIHLFDADDYLQHNAFRAPGATSLEELRAKPKKVDYFRRVYSQMHRGIEPHPYSLNESNVAELKGMAFVFLCMDAGPAKEAVVELLEREDTPFVDVGMGLSLVDGAISGLVRITASTPAKRDHVRGKARISFAEEDGGDYATNIQIADLNAINAAFAVVKWKKLFGFYHDLENEHFTAYSLATNALINDDKP